MYLCPVGEETDWDALRQELFRRMEALDIVPFGRNDEVEWFYSYNLYAGSDTDFESGRERIEELTPQEIGRARRFLAMDGASDQEVGDELIRLMEALASQFSDIPERTSVGPGWMVDVGELFGNIMEDDCFLAIALFHNLDVYPGDGPGPGLELNRDETNLAEQQAFIDRMALLGMDLAGEMSFADLTLTVKDTHAVDFTASIEAIEDVPAEKLRAIARFNRSPDAPDERVRKQLVNMTDSLRRAISEWGTSSHWDGPTLSWSLSPNWEPNYSDESLFAAAALNYVDVLKASDIQCQIKP